MSDVTIHPLPLVQLRYANMHRLPTFRGRSGQPAHTVSDGSDWSPGDWFVATIGELGELAAATSRQEMADELAGVVIYLDLLAMRCGTVLGQDNESLSSVTKAAGTWFDPWKDAFSGLRGLLRFGDRIKKYRRGDETIKSLRAHARSDLRSALMGLARLSLSHGIDLDHAVVSKFNAKSKEVRSPIVLLSRNGGFPGYCAFNEETRQWCDDGEDLS